MYYDALSRNTVKITLTKKDMSDYSLKSDSLRVRNAETKRTLTRFLKKFRSESAIFPDKDIDRLFLEAFPSEDGGCVMYVSTLGMEPLPPSEPEPPVRTVMCVCASLDPILRLCAGIAGKTTDSSLYRLDNCYCLAAVFPADEAQSAARLIREYGEYSDDATDIAYAAEHGSAVCVNNAAAVLSKLI